MLLQKTNQHILMTFKDLIVLRYNEKNKLNSHGYLQLIQEKAVVWVGEKCSYLMLDLK